RERIHLVANGVDTSLFAPRDRAEARGALGLPRDAEVVLFVGRLEPQKGIGELLEAIAQVRASRPRATFALVGNSVWKARGAEARRDRRARRASARRDRNVARRRGRLHAPELDGGDAERRARGARERAARGGVVRRRDSRRARRSAQRPPRPSARSVGPRAG